MCFSLIPFHPDLCVDGQDLIETGWGFERLVPYCGSKSCSAYKNYLQRYYDSNNPERVAQKWKKEKADSATGSNNSDGIGLTTFSCLVTFTSYFVVFHFSSLCSFSLVCHLMNSKVALKMVVAWILLSAW
jgi:hypothetical protein